MRLLAFSRLATLTTLVVAIGACSELYVERQFRLISIGMPEERITKLFGAPWYEIVVLESGESELAAHFHHGLVKTIEYSDGRKIKYRISLAGGIEKYTWGKESSSYSSSPVRLGMTHAEFDAAMKGKVATEDCRTYSGDARADYYLCFKNDKVVSKELRDVPPT